MESMAADQMDMNIEEGTTLEKLVTGTAGEKPARTRSRAAEKRASVQHEESGE